MKKLFCCLFFLLAISCDFQDISYRYPDNPDYVRKNRAGSLSKKNDLLVYGNKENPEKIEKLWQASIETISALFPILSIDHEKRIITTDWHQKSPTSLFRIKLTTQIQGPEIKARNIKITFSKQRNIAKNNQQKIWQDFEEETQSDNQNIRIIVEEILNRAK